MFCSSILGRKLNTSASSVVNQQFVPKHPNVSHADIKRLEDFLFYRPNITVLTGAGISTESGIPDYRSAGVGMYARSKHLPIDYQTFLRSRDARQQYWARNYVAWPRFSSYQPNGIHHALERFEREERLQAIITQNVDCLHTKAGSKNIIELHGNGYLVKCISCEYSIDRHEFQTILTACNTKLPEIASDVARPDGDIDIPRHYLRNFLVPDCPLCNGILKPNIVFFGDKVPKDRLKTIADRIYISDGLLVLGSSLFVFSGYRIVLQAKELNLPLAIVNIGATRADHLADIKLSAKCGDVIPKLFDK